MFTIILFIYLNTIFIHKKRSRGTVPRYCSGNHNISWHLIRGRKQILIWNIRFFPFSINPSFCKLTGRSRLKSFSSCYTVFSIKWVLCSNFQLMLWCERIFYWSTHHSFPEFLTILIDESFFFLSFFELTNDWFQFVR